MQKPSSTAPVEKPIYNAVGVYRARGHYLQRLEQFEKAILAYNEALRWNNNDVPSLLGRSVARSKATHYVGAMADAVQAASLAPDNISAMEIKAKTEYDKCAFERALVLAHRGRQIRRCPPHFAECARHAEQTIKECDGQSAKKVLKTAVSRLKRINLLQEMEDENESSVPQHHSRIKPQPMNQVEKTNRIEKQKADYISQLMSNTYLGMMSHDKYFLAALSKDERLASANKQGSKKLQELADFALADLEKRQDVLRQRCPLYAAQAAGEAARKRLRTIRQERLLKTQRQHTKDAKRLIKAAYATYEEHDTNKCLEAVEFAMDRIQRIPANLLVGKEQFLIELQDIVAKAFLSQKQVSKSMSESNREKRAYVLLGMVVSREPSQDSILRTRPQTPRDATRRLHKLERALAMSTRPGERCFILHELARLHSHVKNILKARYYAMKCTSESRAAGERIWLLNAMYLLARASVQHNNRPEARSTLLEGAGIARSYGFNDVAAFFETSANISIEGEVGSTVGSLQQREQSMIMLMRDEDMKKAAKHLFKRMSAIPVERRFSIMPGARMDDVAVKVNNRRASIMPKMQMPTTITKRQNHPLGFQDFDY